MGPLLGARTWSECVDLQGAGGTVEKAIDDGAFVDSTPGGSVLGSKHGPGPGRKVRYR